MRWLNPTVPPITKEETAANRSLELLFDQLNETVIRYPGTDMKLVYEIGGISG